MLKRLYRGQATTLSPRSRQHPLHRGVHPSGQRRSSLLDRNRCHGRYRLDVYLVPTKEKYVNRPFTGVARNKPVWGHRHYHRWVRLGRDHVDDG